MCEDADGINAVEDREVRRSRRERRCHGCRRAIAAGELYARTACLYDGSWDTIVHCGRCDRLFAMVSDRLGPYEVASARFDCGETWEDPPPEVAALAFVTPSEASEMLAGEYTKRRRMAAERRAT